MWVAASRPELILRRELHDVYKLVNCVSICPGFEKAKGQQIYLAPRSKAIGRWSCLIDLCILATCWYTVRALQPSLSFACLLAVSQNCLREKSQVGDKRVFVSMHPFVDKRLDFPYYCRLKSIVISGLYKIKIELRSLKFLAHPPLKVSKFVVVWHPRLELVAIFLEPSRQPCESLPT